MARSEEQNRDRHRAGQALGPAIAQLFADEGASVCITDIQDDDVLTSQPPNPYRRPAHGRR